MALPKLLIEQVRQRAKHLCEYCHYPEILSTAPLSIDHVQPRSLGGKDTLDNLALACRRCNERRYNFTEGIDPESGLKTPIYNPRRQLWSDYFIWSLDAICIIGITPTGRATCQRLDLNDDRRPDKFIQKSRQQWAVSGFHPPDDDPQQN